MQHHCSNCGRPYEVDQNPTGPIELQRCYSCKVFLQFRTGIPEWVKASEEGIARAAADIDDLNDQIHDRKELIDLIRKFGESVAQGKAIEIQARPKGGVVWEDVERPLWNDRMEYRKKPAATIPPTQS